MIKSPCGTLPVSYTHLDVYKRQVVKVNLPIRKVPAEHKKEYYAIKITGLRGGHSGEDIHRGRANANKLLIRVLRALEENVRFDLSDITGGLKYNAIPRNAEAVIGIEQEDKAAVDAVIERFSGIFADEYRVNDPGITLEAVPQEACLLYTSHGAKRLCDRCAAKH